MSTPTPEIGQVIEKLRDPAVALPQFAKVFDKKLSKLTKYSQFGLTRDMQRDIIEYHSNPPLDEITRQTLWLNILKARQTGASTCCEYAAYPIASWTPGWDHVCIADTDPRAKYLHGRVQLLHQNWDEAWRQKTVAHNETQKLTFDHGGGMRVLSGRGASAGVGQSPNSMHLSEIGFWTDAEYSISKILPALLTQDRALVVMECTPTTDREPSTDYWQAQYMNGKEGNGRWRSKFYPYWDGLLNRRPWQPGDKLSQEELKLLEQYGQLGLGLDHLAFRRYTIDTDVMIRRNPELFRVYYPFDDISCWLRVAGAFLRPDILQFRDHRLVEDNGEDYHEFEAPHPDGTYVIGTDPSGWGVDHGAFVVLRCYTDAEDEVVATYSTDKDPLVFNEMLHKTGLRYNTAIIAPERNGVGAGVIMYLQSRRYPRIYMDQAYKPGIHKHSHDQMMDALADALMDDLVLRSKRLADQIVGYQGDKEVEASAATIILAKGRKDSKRRSRGHWDLLSALCVGILAKGAAPQRFKTREKQEAKVIPFNQMGYDAIQAWRQASEPRQQSRRFKPRRGRK